MQKVMHIVKIIQKIMCENLKVSVHLFWDTLYYVKSIIKCNFIAFLWTKYAHVFKFILAWLAQNRKEGKSFPYQSQKTFLQPNNKTRTTFILLAAS